MLAELAVAFAGEFFKDIVPGTRLHQQGRAFSWPMTIVTTEDRLLVVIRAIRQAGFPTIGSFLAALFDRRYSRHSSVYTSIASFLRGAEQNTAHHPVAIVNLIFHHGKSQRWDAGVAEEPSFSLPRHALRPSLRLDSNLLPPGSNSTRNGLINWALGVVLERTDKEANRLVDPVHGFVRLPKTEGWSWDMILTTWSMLKSQETVAKVAPAIFAVGTTVAVNYRTRRKLWIAAAPPPNPAPLSSPLAPVASIASELPFHPLHAGPDESSAAPEPPEKEKDAGSDEEEEEPEESIGPSFIASKIGRRTV
ncbi:hypothetical protein C8R47DRAFT_1199530 [Mycena vitilis]|nr:hypothetical protein C8R47DRAFT_1199530 [Mycena vitilis]